MDSSTRPRRVRSDLVIHWIYRVVVPSISVTVTVENEIDNDATGSLCTYGRGRRDRVRKADY